MAAEPGTSSGSAASAAQRAVRSLPLAFVTGAVIGVLGGMIGAAEGLSTLGGEPRGVALGLVGFVIAAAAAVAVAAALPGGKRDNPGIPEQDRLSQTAR